MELTLGALAGALSQVFTLPIAVVNTRYGGPSCRKNYCLHHAMLIKRVMLLCTVLIDAIL